MENNFKFYNTLTKKIETVIPHEDGKIAILWKMFWKNHFVMSDMT